MLKYCLFTFLIFNILIACSHLTYYTQAMSGQLEVYGRARPIANILTDTTVSPDLKQQLTDILRIRAFAIETLYLPGEASYTQYADLERDFAMWSVFATPSFSLKPKQWCFLFAGCIGYLPYFDREQAFILAEHLEAQHYDVYVGGTIAYSTLGWTHDPIFNTMLRLTKPEIAGLVFHELAHRLLYIPGDTVFNESFATAVEEIGTTRWLAQYGTSTMRTEYQQIKQREASFTALVLDAHDHLEQLYQEDLSPVHMQAAKDYVLKKLQKRYQIVKDTQWGGFSGYDNWFKTLNNAKLASVMTYKNYVPAFKALLAQHKGNLKTFYQAATHLGQLTKEQRHNQLQQLYVQ